MINLQRYKKEKIKEIEDKTLEEVVEEIESNPEIACDWCTFYSDCESGNDENDCKLGIREFLKKKVQND